MDYIVKVSAEINYWWERQYRVTASNFGTAVRRGFEEFRRDLTESRGRKQIDKVKIEIIRI